MKCRNGRPKTFHAGLEGVPTSIPYNNTSTSMYQPVHSKDGRSKVQSPLCMVSLHLRECLTMGLQVVMTPWVYEVTKRSVADNLSQAIKKHGSPARSEFDKLCPLPRNTLFDPKPNPYYEHRGNYPNDRDDPNDPGAIVLHK